MSACLTAGPSDRSRSKLVFLINVRLREGACVLFRQRHAEWVGIDNESDQVP
jgi:hypothetical protein